MKHLPCAICSFIASKIRHFYIRVNKYARLLIWGLIAVAAALYSTLSIVRHYRFQTGAFDLGIYDQAVWQYSRFHFPYNTIKQDLILGDHLTLTLPLLSPLLWIWNDPKTLLLFQAIWISISTYAIFRYLISKKFSGIVSILLSALYIFFYGIQYAVFFDFHPVMIGVGLMAWILYFWEIKKWQLFLLSVATLLLTQENMGFALTALSFIWFFEGRQRRLAVALGVFGFAYSIGAFLLVSSISAITSQYAPDFPSQPSQYVTRFYDAPQKQQVWLYSYAWFSFVPTISIGSVLAVLSDLGQYFITGKAYERMWGIATHHRAILSIYLTAGTAQSLILFRKWNIRPIVLALILCGSALFQQYYFHHPINKLAKQSFWSIEQWMNDNRNLLSTVQPGDSIAAQQSLVPHISHRDEIYLIYPHEKENGWWLDFAGKPEFLLVDTHPGVWLTMTLAHEDQFAEAIANMIAAEKIELIEGFGDARKYKINY